MTAVDEQRQHEQSREFHDTQNAAANDQPNVSIDAIFETLQSISGASNPRLCAWLQDELLPYFYIDGTEREDSPLRADLEEKSHVFDRAHIIEDAVVTLKEMRRSALRGDSAAQRMYMRSKAREIYEAMVDINVTFAQHWTPEKIHAVWNGRAENDLINSAFAIIGRSEKLLCVCSLWLKLAK